MRKLIQANVNSESSSDHNHSRAAVGKSPMHESAIQHVTGRAKYVDDLPLVPGLLHVATGQSPHAHARIVSVDLDAVKRAEGVLDVIVQADIPGEIDVAPVYHGDPLLAGDEVEYVGQPVFAVAATSFEAAQRAVALAIIVYEPLPAQLTIEDALAADTYVLPQHELLMDQPEQAIADAPLQLTGEIYVRGQEHFYLEGQVCQVAPTETGVAISSSSQHPTEVQKLVAEVLDIPLHHVVVEVRRAGGGFGGKESQAAPLACMAAIFAVRTGRTVRYRMPRRDDMVQTGKRHDFLNRWHAGFDRDGKIHGVTMQLAGLCGYSADLSEGIVDRAMFHADNAYYLNNARILGLRCKTHTVSNTAFRGFGGPKGMMAIETLIEDIARTVGKDPLDVRKLNLYREGFDETPYGQKVEQHVLPDLITQLEKNSDYRERRAAITAFNKGSRYIKKGLALTPVKFGISFTASHLNQAGALLHIYTDGSILINHGGIEMGQGLYTKIRQIVAHAFGVNLQRVGVTATRTDKVPNTSPTAASSGTDLNGMAALDACNRIKADLVAFAIERYGVSADAVIFSNDEVHCGEQRIGFNEFIKQAYLARVPLFATGYYKTPKIYYDRQRAKGHPFFYYANGAAVAEVRVDVLTGEYKVDRVDVLHDAGSSLNPALDIGQVEGAFVQGMGWLTTEELLWNTKGQIISNSPANYKIPTAFDVPEDFRVALYDQPNREESIHRSKAVGEPPLMLAISVWAALRDACASLCDYRKSPRLDTPATPERVFYAMRQCADWHKQVVL